MVIFLHTNGPGNSNNPPTFEQLPTPLPHIFEIYNDLTYSYKRKATRTSL